MVSGIAPFFLIAEDSSRQPDVPIGIHENRIIEIGLFIWDGQNEEAFRQNEGCAFHKAGRFLARMTRVIESRDLDVFALFEFQEILQKQVLIVSVWDIVVHGISFFLTKVGLIFVIGIVRENDCHVGKCFLQGLAKQALPGARPIGDCNHESHLFSSEDIVAYLALSREKRRPFELSLGPNIVTIVAMNQDNEEKHASSLKKWRKAADIVWNVFLNGVIGYVLYVLMGALFCLTLIGIPFFSSYYRYAKHLFHPANCKLVQNRDVKGFMKVMTFVHLVVFGWEEWLLCMVFAGLCYVSVIYIPIGKQLFRQAKFFFNPRSYTFEDISYQGVKDEEKVEKEPKKEVEEPKKEEKPVEEAKPVEGAKPTPAPAPEKADQPTIIYAPTPETPKAQAKPAEKEKDPHERDKKAIVVQYFNYTDQDPEGPYGDWAHKKW